MKLLKAIGQLQAQLKNEQSRHRINLKINQKKPKRLQRKEVLAGKCLMFG
jgi:hypothetical protein